jgi:hypothetical protein
MAQRSGKHYFSQRTEWSAARLNVASSCDHWKQVEDRVTTDEVPDPHSLNIKLTIGGKLLQLSNTRELIFRIPDLITYISSITPLQRETSSARELLQEWGLAVYLIVGCGRARSSLPRLKGSDS